MSNNRNDRISQLISKLDNVAPQLANEVTEVLGNLKPEITVKLGLNRETRVAIAIIAGILAGILYALIVLNWYRSPIDTDTRSFWQSPWMTLIIAVVIGIVTYFLLQTV